MRITAEGVEQEGQLAMLRAEGCTEIQGYYYSRPRPARELPALLERWVSGGQLAVVSGQLSVVRSG
jgi:EAL domain-containing protein (putative c-di-GMP-specific phosphodiesterase class I)